MKYTKEVLEEPVKQSKSFAEVLRKLGVRQSGGMQSHIKRLVIRYGINTAHFLGQGVNQNSHPKGGFPKLPWHQVLVKERSGSTYKEKTALLRRVMLESGIPHLCEKCSCEPIWLGEPLVLQIDHINGDNRDNQRHNLRFLCPNCHSQTSTFGARNHGKMYDADFDELYEWRGEEVDEEDFEYAGVAKLVDAVDLESAGQP